MPLLSLWNSNKEAVDELSIEQVVMTAGDGSLKDASICSSELREYISQIETEKISSYVEQCLSTSFNKGGLVLQDLVNELGRRLDYNVTNGRYQGAVNRIGFDGLWNSPEGHAIIAEVKTTDAYRLSLDTLAGYRNKLIAEGHITGASSVLIIVGRQDTGELEAQVRGSRHAWDFRLISVEALLKLVQLKENTDETETGRKIRSLLAPMEYTRLDRMVDVMFTTVVDVETSAAPQAPSDPEDEVQQSSEELTESHYNFTGNSLLQAKRASILSALATSQAVPLIRKSRALYWSADHSVRIACSISKRYMRDSSRYWYAYHPQWDEFLREGSNSLFVLGCMDLDVAFSIERTELKARLGSLNTTIKEDGSLY